MPKNSKISKTAVIISVGGLFLLIGVFIFLSFKFTESKPKEVSVRKVKTYFGFKREIGEPYGIAVKDGEVFVSDGMNGRILRIRDNESFDIITDELDTPSAIAFDSKGDLIVADSGTHTIKKINLSEYKPANSDKPSWGEDDFVQTIAGSENKIGYTDGEIKNSTFNAPIGIAVGKNDEIYVADTYNDRIRKIENGFVSTIAGGIKGFSDGIGSEAKFDTPCGIAVTEDGRILVADSGNARIRVIEPDGRTWTLAGKNQQDSYDGLLNEAKFVQPMDIEIDDLGVIYVADGNSIRAIGRRVLPFVETISDTTRGFSDGLPWNAKFNRPSGLALDEKGNLFVADSENQVLRVFTDDEFGKEITYAEIEKLKFSAEEFKSRNEPRWTFNPADREREIAGTFGEIRGEIIDESSNVYFHNGLDITGAYGETALFIRDEKVLHPFAVQNFETLRELIRMPELGYIHIRIGRDEENNFYSDGRFQFQFNEDQTLKGVRIPRGSKFTVSEPIGTLNRMNHIHLVAGKNQNMMNALNALDLPDIKDTRPPTIEEVSLFDEDWNEFETENGNERIKLTGKTQIVVQAFDQMDKNPERRKLGVYRVGYQVLKNDEPTSDIKWTILFDRLPSDEAVKLVYAKGSKSGATGETIFRYIASNEVSGDDFRKSFFDASKLEEGKYTLRVFVADFFGNQTSSDVKLLIEK